jgi:hypothetical protein
MVEVELFFFILCLYNNFLLSVLLFFYVCIIMFLTLYRVAMVLRFLDHQQKRQFYIGDFRSVLKLHFFTSFQGDSCSQLPMTIIMILNLSLGWILRLLDQNHQSYMSFHSTRIKKEAE